MKAYVSLWSADLLALGAAVDQLGDVVDGFHLDVFDGHNVRDLLFGPAHVAALRSRTAAVLDVHLNVTGPDYWVDRFAEAGADMITVQSGPCPDVGATLARIRDHGCRVSLGLEVGEPVSQAVPFLPVVDRLLLMGTVIGVKGYDQDPATAGRVGELVSARHGEPGPDVVVDGGIRRHTVPGLAAAGADGVVPGSLVFGQPDPRQAVAEIHALRPGDGSAPRSQFWTVGAPS
ncbi:MAG TPA: ribulose-phosphate 3-epimerase [Streptosporangiaceae bacterium]|nr:ribulose-phosphate 3-epimerase [Streptosporangiaceae bacterium]